MNATPSDGITSRADPRHGCQAAIPRAALNIKVGNRARAIAITPNGSIAYVVSGSNTVTPIRTATNKALKAIKVGASPDAIAITRSGPLNRGIERLNPPS